MRIIQRYKLIAAFACAVAVTVEPMTTVADPAITSPAGIQLRLEEYQGEALKKFIQSIPTVVASLEDASEDEIQAIIKKLEVIKSRDIYQEPAYSKGTTNGLYFSNRVTAEWCIDHLKREKQIRQIRKLPLGERVISLMSELKNGRSRSFKSWNLHADANFLNAYEKELVRTGTAGVHLMIQQSHAHPQTKQSVVNVLRYLPDPKSEEYLIDTLLNQSGDDLYVRSDAAFALGAMSGPKVLEALADSLLDSEYEELDRDPPQIAHKLSEWQIARFYAVRYVASESLSKLTGKHWGSLYNEEYAIWKAWLEAGDKEGFDPDSVRLEDKDLRKLVQMLFHRRMSGRPNPWQSRNELEKSLEMDSIAKSLESRGGKVIGMLVEECRERIAESPKFDADLRAWTRELLERMSWESAKSAAKELE